VKRLARNRILLGDVRERLLDLPAASIDCVITSPPYYQLRDYGIDGQLGLESTVEGWVNELRLALNDLTRVLKPSGSLWLNLGDSYSRHTKYGAPPKGLLLARSYPLGSAGIGSRRGIAALMGVDRY
jgi:DNA modification methylase